MKSIAKVVLTVTSRVLFVVCLPFLYLVEPFWRIRLGHLAHEGRFGHLSLNHELFIRRLNAATWPPRTSYIIAAWQPANRQFLTLLKRTLPIYESRLAKHVILAIVPLLRHTRFHVTFPFRSTEHYEFSELPPAFSFSDDEEHKGQRALETMGIGPHDWFVCVHARDPSYLVLREGFVGVGTNDVEEARGLRDCAVENFIPAMQWIADQGGIALRVGAIVEKPLPDLSPRIIDYATHYRDDFLDVWLTARNRFFFGSASGAHSGAYCFNAPVSGVNWAPYNNHPMGTRALFTPKLLRHKAEDRLLTFPEIRDMGMFDPTPKQHQAFKKSPKEFEAEFGIVWQENTPDEILDQCKDMMDLVNGIAPPAGAQRLQEVYRNFYTGPNNSEYAGRLGPRFALRHRHLIEPSG